MKKDLTVEAQKKRFQQILEFTYHGKGSGLMGEAGEEEQQPDNADVPMDGASDNTNVPPMDDNAMQPDAQGAMPPADGMPQEPDANVQQQTPPGFNPQEIGGEENADITPDDFEGGVTPDDNVVDVTELTDAQEETQKDIEKYGKEFQKAFQVLGQWEELIKSNNEKIEDLKAEFEKRNPTQVEKLSMQTAKSEPFNVKPEEFWDEKEKTSNYRTESDNNGVGQGQYTITKNDIDGTTDWKAISDSLDDEVLYHPTLENTMGNW